MVYLTKQKFLATIVWLYDTFFSLSFLVPHPLLFLFPSVVYFLHISCITCIAPLFFFFKENSSGVLSVLQYYTQVEVYCDEPRLGKKHFIVNSKILGIQIWWKKNKNYKKFEIAKKQRKLQILPECIHFLPFDR